MTKPACILCVLFFLAVSLRGQSAPAMRHSDTIGVSSKTENIYNVPLFADSLASSFCIVIRKEVKSHKHMNHCEHVVVTDGTGIMKLGDKTFPIQKGDVIFIPKNTIHSVKTTSREPLKVISVQAPLFDGKDRIMTEEK